MHKDPFVFAQLVQFMNRSKFNRIVAKYDGDKYVKSFSCWNQLLTMMFGQLTNRESLRDLIVATEAHSGKLYHLGMGKSVTRSNLSKANEQRDYRIFEEFAYFMIAQARSKRQTDIFKLGGNVYAFDSTTIDLCLAVFDWAKFRRNKGGVKVHTLYDIEAQNPCVLAYYSFSSRLKGHAGDSAWLKCVLHIRPKAITISPIFFTYTPSDQLRSRAKANLKYRVVSWKRLPKGVLSKVRLSIYRL